MRPTTAKLLMFSAALLAAITLTPVAIRVTAQRTDPAVDSPAGADSPATVLSELATRPPMAKLAPQLRQIVGHPDSDERTLIVVESATDVDLSGFAERIHSFTWPEGEHVSILEARSVDLARIAALPGVARVSSGVADPSRRPPVDRSPQLAEDRSGAGNSLSRLLGERGLSQAEISWAAGQSAVAPAAPPSAAQSKRADAVGIKAAGSEQLGAAAAGAASRNQDDAVASGTPADRPDGWYDIRDGHRAAEAWQLGYRGTGVRVAVLDTGVDFAHQDLQGTWAVLPDSSPYAGWPQVYDPTATFQFVQDRTVGPADQNLRTAQGGLLEVYQESAVRAAEVDGRQVLTACFQALHVSMLTGERRLADPDCDYVVPNSESGQVRFGHHPDTSLAMIRLGSESYPNVELFDPATGSWSEAASMATDRQSPSATKMADGRVLVAGGSDPDGNVAMSEIYDPAGDTWQPAGELNTPRFSHLAALLPDGRVLIAGGSDDVEPLSSAELYDPTANSWQATASMAVSRTNATATRLPDGRVLVAGGNSDSGAASVLASAELFDPQTDSWQPASSMSTPRRNHVAALLESGLVLVAGGNGGDDPYVSAELYDPTADRWLPTGDMTTGHSNAMVAPLADGRVLVTGGIKGVLAAIVDSEVFDPADGTWSNVGDLQTARTLATATTLDDGQVLVAGGLNEDIFDPYASAELFDPATATWGETEPMATGRMFHEAVLLDDGRVLVVGGFTSGAFQSQTSVEFVGVLLVDANEPGVYDTVYVDLDSDHDFTDEQPVTKASPLAAKDINDPPDGITDLSGGLLYYLADGERPVPGAYLWGVEDEVPEAGTVVGLFIDLGQHGSLCGSAVVSQGRLRDLRRLLSFRALPGGPEAVNPGMAPDAKLVGVGDVYGTQIVFESAWRYAVFGNDPDRTDDDVQVASNSYGWSETDNDGWDADSRFIDHYVRHFSPSTSFLVSTGNGAPGYGTISPPSPATGLGIAASTQYGTAIVHSITDTNQITFGDIAAFSNRGPGADGRNGPDIAANGSAGWGAIPINYFSADPDLIAAGRGLGAMANVPWGGTSRSSPVAAGAMALTYQAFRAKQGRWPTWHEARSILMAGARYAAYDTFTMGAGVLDAADAVRIASGDHGIYAIPAQWTAGDYRGVAYPAFAKLMTPGQSDEVTLTLHNPSAMPIDVNLTGQTPRLLGAYEAALDTDLANESPYNSKVPDYLVAIDRAQVPAGAELLIARAILPLDQADINRDDGYQLENSFTLRILQHTDWDGDGELWSDRNSNGAVNSAVEGRAIDWAATEIDRYEYEALNEHAAESNNWSVETHHPLERWRDGLYLAVWHNAMSCDDEEDPSTCTGRTPLMPETSMRLHFEFYAYQTWDWLALNRQSVTVPAGGTAAVVASLEVPAGTQPGGYQGALFADYARGDGDVPVATGGGYELPTQRVVIPVNANVAANYDWKGSLNLGGDAADDSGATYSNGTVRGGADRVWRPETGDWRFFFVDAERPDSGTQWLARTRWDDPVEEASDIDASLWGRDVDRYSDPTHPDNRADDWSDPAWYGPYSLKRLGHSRDAFVGGGTWRFDTSSGSNEDWIAGPASEGLTELMLHNVLFSGSQFELPFETLLSSVRIQPSPMHLYGDECTTMRLTSQVDLDGFTMLAAGLSAPVEIIGQALGASEPYSHTVTVTGAALRFVVDLRGQPGTDIDLAVEYDEDGDGVGDWEVGSSASETENEHIELVGAQPAGTYIVIVMPYSVPPSGTTFDLTIDVVAGNGLPAAAAPTEVVAGREYSVEICPAADEGAAGPLSGVIDFGPASAPALISVDVTWALEQPGRTLYLPRLQSD